MPCPDGAHLLYHRGMISSYDFQVYSCKLCHTSSHCILPLGKCWLKTKTLAVSLATQLHNTVIRYCPCYAWLVWHCNILCNGSKPLCACQAASKLPCLACQSSAQHPHPQLACRRPLASKSNVRYLNPSAATVSTHHADEHTQLTSGLDVLKRGCGFWRGGITYLHVQPPWCTGCVPSDPPVGRPHIPGPQCRIFLICR